MQTRCCVASVEVKKSASSNSPEKTSELAPVFTYWTPAWPKTYYFFQSIAAMFPLYNLSFLMLFIHLLMQHHEKVSPVPSETSNIFNASSSE